MFAADARFCSIYCFAKVGVVTRGESSVAQFEECRTCDEKAMMPHETLFSPFNLLSLFCGK